MSLISVFEEEMQARERSQTTTEAWWIPHDPITETSLVLVLTKMAKCVLDHAEERSDSHQLEPGEPPPLLYVEPLEGGVPVSDLLHPADGDIEP